jgi:pimeloyl-ACP methyl ester carboxylesterase
MSEFVVERAGVRLAGEEAGEGTPVVLLHGLTATRRYVVMGSRALERGGHRVIGYDARGHGHSSPAEAPDAYGYAELSADLLALLATLGVERAVLVGASMGAHTLLRFTLEHPERVRGIVAITPAYDPELFDQPGAFDRWDALADGLREGGIEGFVAANHVVNLPVAWRETVTTVLRQRMSRHEHLEAVADALRIVPRSRPFATLDDLATIAVPTVIVASRDEADPEHPLAVGHAYADAIPGAQLLTEDEGKSPLAWQGGQLSRVIAETAARAA